MEIRTLTEADAQALWELRKRALETDPDAFGEALEEHLRFPAGAKVERLKGSSDEKFVLGAVQESKLVGMAGFYRDLQIKRRHRGWIWGMYVTPECRGQGVGRLLLEEVIRRAGRIPGLRRVLLSVVETQPGAQRLYASLGFEVYGSEPMAVRATGGLATEHHMGLTLPL